MLVPINPIPTTPAVPGPSAERLLRTLPSCATRLPGLATIPLLKKHEFRLQRAQATSRHLNSFLKRLFHLLQGQVDVALRVGCRNRTLLRGNWKHKDSALNEELPESRIQCEIVIGSE